MNDYPIHPLCAMSPGMSVEQFAEFKADIQANGQREPVKVWCEQIIDGRHRAQACKELGLNLKTTIVNLTEAELPAYVLSLNAMRNHLTTGQRGMYVADVTAHYTKGWNLKKPLGDKILSPTTQQLATAVGVSRMTVVTAKKIQKVADSSVTQAVRDGKISLHAAEKIVEAVPEKTGQPAAVERWMAEPVKKFRKVVPVTGGKVHSPPRRKEPIEDLVDRAVTNLDVATQALETYGERSAPSPDQRASWESILDRAAGIIRRFRAHLKEVAA